MFHMCWLCNPFLEIPMRQSIAMEDSGPDCFKLLLLAVQRAFAKKALLYG